MRTGAAARSPAVPSWTPAPACTTMPGGLIDHNRAVVLIENRERNIFRRGAKRRQFARAPHRSLRRHGERADDFTVCPSTSTRPSRIQVCSRERLNCGSRSCSRLSSRLPRSLVRRLNSSSAALKIRNPLFSLVQTVRVQLTQIPELQIGKRYSGRWVLRILPESAGERFVVLRSIWSYFE